MAQVVNRHPTAINHHLARLQRFKVFGAIAQAVGEAQWQRSEHGLQKGYGPSVPPSSVYGPGPQCCSRSVAVYALARFQRISIAGWLLTRSIDMKRYVSSGATFESRLCLV